MISIWTVLYIMSAHFIADFVFQSHHMATNKSTSNYWLSLHVITYMFTMLFFSMMAVPLIFTNPISVLIWVMVNGVLHWLTDYVTSRCSSFYFKKQDYHNGFVVVGVDQYIHLACLTLTLVYLI